MKDKDFVFTAIAFLIAIVIITLAIIGALHFGHVRSVELKKAMVEHGMGAPEILYGKCEFTQGGDGVTLLVCELGNSARQ